MTTHATSITTDPTTKRYDALLAEIEAARQQQLDALPTTNLDAVAAAYRGTVERILDDVRAARRRAAAGCYGVCTECAGEIAADRLEARPWAVTCARCGR